MRVSLLNLKVIRLVAIFGLASLIVSCTSEGSKSGEGDTEVDKEALQKEKLVKEAKKVMYSLPSPIETAMLIKRAGADYNEEILNPVSNVSKYNTNKDKALNMGVYGADLSYASIFDQTQTVMKYMQVSKKLADDLGLLSSIDSKIVERLENNVNDRDSIIRIISETFMNSNSTLKEDNRPAIAAMILAGGWIEGLYIATTLAQDVKQEELVARIVDQRLSFNEMQKLLESNSDNQEIVQIIESLSGVKEAFAAIRVETTEIVPVTDKESKVTTLKSKSKHSLTQEQFDKLKKETIALRNSIIE
ncbi:MAG: hypothetical protein IPO21_17675 [Bacteroidales bacterium]|nr:hypothetical protein [Bacteroidales bacterium]